jgi:opacity protein-like surface antigen
MRLFALMSLAAVIALAQAPDAKQAPSWRSSISSLPAAPPPSTTNQDIVRFEKNMRMAASYLGNTTPNANAAQWEANRAMVRSMATYLSGLQSLSGNSQFRGSIRRAQHSFDSLGLAAYLAYMMSANAPGTEVQPASAAPQPLENGGPMSPPFALEAPELSDVAGPDKETASELRTRYEADAAHSAGIWQNAENLRQNLEARGMGLNLSTATSMLRLPQYFKSAATALRRNDWEEAHTRLEQAEAETEKIARTVGR